MSAPIGNRSNVVGATTLPLIEEFELAELETA